MLVTAAGTCKAVERLSGMKIPNSVSNSYLVQTGDNFSEINKVNTPCYLKVWPQEWKQLPCGADNFVRVWNTNVPRVQAGGAQPGLVLSPSGESPGQSRYGVITQAHRCLKQIAVEGVIFHLSHASEPCWLNCRELLQ